MMFQPWEYRTESGFKGAETDLIGFAVAALDGDIGHVDEATYETGSSYLVVDTGPWIFGRKVDAGRCGPADRHRRQEDLRRSDQGPDQERTSSSTISPMTPSTGTGSAATTPSRTTPRHQEVT